MNKVEAGLLGITSLSGAGLVPEVIDSFSNNRMMEGSIRGALAVIDLAIIGLVASGKLKYNPSHNNPPEDLMRAFLAPSDTQQITKALKTLEEIAADPQGAENGAVIHLDNDLTLELPPSSSTK